MDPRHQNGDNQENPSMSGNYGYHFAQNDAFNSFLQPDQEPSFNAPWDTEAFSNAQEPISGFNQGNNGWHQNSIQPSNLLPVGNHGAHSRPFDQTYSRSPASFNYPGFQSHPGHTLPTPSYDASLGYGQLPLNEDSPYGYGRPQAFQRTSNQTQTISPQALQHYPTFTQDAQHQRQVSWSFSDTAMLYCALDTDLLAATAVESRPRFGFAKIFLAWELSSCACHSTGMEVHVSCCTKGRTSWRVSC